MPQSKSFLFIVLSLTLFFSAQVFGKDNDEPDLDGYIDKAAEKAAEEAIKAAERAAEDAARAAEDAAEQAAEDAARAAEKAAEDAAEDASRAAEKAAEDAAEEASRAAEEAAEEASKEASRAAEEAAEAMAEAFEEEIEAAEDRLKDLQKTQKETEKALLKSQRLKDRGKNSKSQRHKTIADNKKKSLAKSSPSIHSRLSRDSFGHEVIADETLISIPLKRLTVLEKKLGIIDSQKYPSLGIALIKSHKTKLKEPPISPHEIPGQDGIISSPNHIYYGIASLDSPKLDGILPEHLNHWPESYKTATPAIGVIDTAIPESYTPNNKLTIRSFVDNNIAQPTEHGMAVVSILGADSESYRGLLPQSRIYLASVFEKDEAGVTRTSTEKLIEAINWMVEMKIPVINMSLTGPANEILESTIQQAYQKGTTIVSAAGNAGPFAAPLYPSGYSRVVAVTAVSANKKVYRRANRGKHIDFAAPGVDILHPDGGNDYLKASSGTSMAAPFVAALLSAKCAEHTSKKCPMENILDQIKLEAEDLGKPGYDPVYGYGLVVR